jgi:hypothetical protein
VRPPARKLGGRAGWTGWVLGLAMMLDCRSASAETPRGQTVILLEPATASPVVRRSFARIRDEASADRFRVVSDSTADGGPSATRNRAANDREASTILTLFGDPETGQAELCLFQRTAQRTVVRRAVVADDPDRMPEALAARALELLRATALELSIEIEQAPRAKTPAEPTVAADPPAARIAPEVPSVVAAMGVGIWNSLDGPPAAVTPLARIGLRLSRWAWARLSIAGLGTRPRVDSAHGKASLSQSMGLAELAAVFRDGKRIQSSITVGAGAIDVAVVGTGVAPYEGREPRRWSAAFDAGVGVSFALGPRAAVVTELHALLAAPHVVVRLADTRAATIGFPSLILTIALQVAP